MQTMKIAIALILLVVFASSANSGPQSWASGCRDQSATFEANAGISSGLGSGGFEYQSLEGTSGEWPATYVGDDIEACIEWVSTWGNFQFRWVCESTWFTIEANIDFTIPSGSASSLVLTASSHNADVDMHIGHLYPGTGAGCDPCQTWAIFSRHHHQTHFNASESINHVITYPLIEDRYYGFMWYSNTGADVTMTMLEGSFIQYTTNTCQRGTYP